MMNHLRKYWISYLLELAFLVLMIYRIVIGAAAQDWRTIGLSSFGIVVGIIIFQVIRFYQSMTRG